jgi:hypothetical protein
MASSEGNSEIRGYEFLDSGFQPTEAGKAFWLKHRYDHQIHHSLPKYGYPKLFSAMSTVKTARLNIRRLQRTFSLVRKDQWHFDRVIQKEESAFRPVSEDK